MIETSPSDSHRLVSVEVEGVELAGVYFAQKNEKKPLYQALDTASDELLKRIGISKAHSASFAMSGTG
ncbi:hypothetical protein MK280_12375 [Myxococcota bacterium]|nr:hypothetical protein [Myxococcota bacterium]